LASKKCHEEAAPVQYDDAQEVDQEIDQEIDQEVDQEVAFHAQAINIAINQPDIAEIIHLYLFHRDPDAHAHVHAHALLTDAEDDNKITYNNL